MNTTTNPIGTETDEKAPDRQTYSQEAVLNAAIASGEVMAVYLINGIRLNGVIKGQDTYCLFLTMAGNLKIQLVYKHAISTIGAGSPR